MQGRVSILKFLLTIVIGVIFGGLVFGGFGFLLSGKVGFVNLLPWGLAFGLFGSISVGFGNLIEAHYWAVTCRELVKLCTRKTLGMGRRITTIKKFLDAPATK